MRLLAGREHSRRELHSKLRSRGFDADEIEATLDGLSERGLQSDLRFAENYAEMRLRKGYGPVRIRAELRERGIDDDLIQVSLEPFADDWFERLRQVHDTKYGSELPQNQKEMTRRARFLEYRGFPGDLIAALLFD